MYYIDKSSIFTSKVPLFNPSRVVMTDERGTYSRSPNEINLVTTLQCITILTIRELCWLTHFLTVESVLATPVHLSPILGFFTCLDS